MYHYLFTNDLRVSDLGDKLFDASKYIKTDTVPSAAQDKSLNNNINTLAFYFGLLRESENVRLCLSGRERNVVLNFIKKFQFPNPRTLESYQQACADEIKLAPLRFILQVLYVFRMIAPEEAYMSEQEILDFIFYNSDAAKNESPSALSVAVDILNFRQTGEYPDSVETDPVKRFWKHESRQIHEITDILEWSGCVTRTSGGHIEIKHKDLSDADKSMLFDILTCNDFWEGDRALSFDEIKNSYLSYLDSDLAAELDKVSESSGSNVDCLTVALKLFAAKRDVFPALNEVCKATGVDLCEEFSDWAKKSKGRTEKAIDDAIAYLKSLTTPLQKPQITIWHGLREALYGTPAGKDVFHVASLAEFDDLFGRIAQVFEKDPNSDGLDEERYKQCRDWHENAKSSYLPGVYKLYREFIEWRYGNSRMSYDAWAKAVRSEFGLVDESLVGSDGFDYGAYMRKYAITPTVANTKFARHSADVQWTVLKFLHDEKNAPHDADWYIDEGNRPKHNGTDIVGFGPTATLFFMMELRPEKFASWSKMVFDSLRDLGLYIGQTPTALTQESYEYSFAQQVLLKSKMKEMGIGKAADDQSDADFLTVNEFLWFVSKNFQEIKNMAKQMHQKTVTQSRTAGTNDWSKLPNDNPDSLMYRLAASLLTRPFAILAGASGTGKSRMVKKLACMTCYDDDLKPSADKTLGNYQMIQVKPSWHDSSELLGYRSMLNPNPNVVDYKSTDFVRFVLKAHAYPNTPFFACLDEMNLAPVEQYFAEFLSACESVEKKEIKDDDGNVTDSFYVTDPLIPPTEYNDDIENIGLEYPLEQKVKDRLNKFGLYIPRNLFVVGTVNMDDTTCQFSRKVLDRAMTIEMNEVKFGALKDPEELSVTGPKGLLMTENLIKAFIDRKDFRKETLDSDFLDLLEKIQEIVKPTPFAVGYRFALETSMYREALKVINAEKMEVGKLDADNNPVLKADGCGNEKVDVSGVYALDHMILMKILPRITGNKNDQVRADLIAGLEGYFADKLAGHDQSKDALHAMVTRAEGNGGYLSFWP